MKKFSTNLALILCLLMFTSLAFAQVFPPVHEPGPFPTGTEVVRNDAPANTSIPDGMGTLYEYTAYRGTPVIDGTVTVGNATVTLEIATVLVTGSEVTIEHSGSVAGTTDSATPTAANTVAAGGSIEIITDGGSTDASRAIVMLTMQRT